MTWADAIALVDEFIPRYGSMPAGALRELRIVMREREQAEAPIVVEAREVACSCGDCQRVTPTNTSTYDARPQDWGEQ
jgi:hypothetical protein